MSQARGEHAVGSSSAVPGHRPLDILIVTSEAPPIVSGISTCIDRLATGLDPDVFLGRWALTSAALFAASAAVFALRWWRTLRHRAWKADGDGPDRRTGGKV